MCDVLDKVENKGKAEGKIEGKNQMALLVKKLLDQSRIEDVKRASEDEASRQTQISIDLLPLQAYFTQISIEYETYSVFETILHKLQNEYVH